MDREDEAGRARRSKPSLTRRFRGEDTDERDRPRPSRMGPWQWVGAAVALGALAFVLLWQRCGLRGCPDVDELRGYMPDEASVVLDREGMEISKLYTTRRMIVPIDSIPQVVRDAFVAIEDRRFWEHDGVDVRRVFGALWVNLRALEIEEGSSTITMQLARNVFPEKLPAGERTLWRKLGEARVASEIEKRYTKEEILALYLNHIYFGQGAYGIEAAAQEYFGKAASQLDLAEAAMLAALPRAPSRLNPRSNREAALEGRALVLNRMLNQGLISAEDAERAKESPLRLRRGRTADERAPYFVEAVRRQLEDQLGDVLYTGGFRIHTTLDPAAQEVLEEEVKRQVQAIESGRYGRFPHPSYETVHADSADLSQGTPYLQAAAVIMDAQTGDVLALVGGRDFSESQFNRATQALRQPGSAFKPFVYAAALGAGYPVTHRLMDEPIRLVLDNRRVWEPRNYDGSYSGEMTLRDALVRSKNVVTVRLATEMGVQRAAAMAEQMGVASRIPTNPSVVLGTAEVTPLAMTASYAAFATLGSRPEPRFVVRVADRHGNTVWARQPHVQRVLDPGVAFLVTNILQDAVNRGTGTAVRGVGFRGTAAGKTGTTQDASDVWFVGYTPRRVATIWLGFDERKTVVRGATGGELAAPIWGRTMRRIGADADGRWEPPSGIETRAVDSYGYVIADNCPQSAATHREYFLMGTAPMATCSPGYHYSYYDSLGYDTRDTLYGNPRDTLGSDGWWERLRGRFRGSEDGDTVRRDSPVVRMDTLRQRPRADTARVRLDTMRIRPDTARRDTARRDTAPRDRVRRDTIRRDTIRRDTVRRDTIRRDTIRRDTVRRDTIGAEAIRPATVRREEAGVRLGGDPIERDTTAESGARPDTRRR